MKNETRKTYARKFGAMLLALALLTPVAAQAAYRTHEIDKWGYKKDSLVLMMKSGETLFIAPGKCSTDDFNKVFDSFSEIDLRINANRIAPDADFTLSALHDDGAHQTIKCAVKTITE